jgi:predicted Zn-dependent protease
MRDFGDIKMKNYRVEMIILVLLSAVLVPGCAINPVTGENQFMLMKPAQDLEIGKKYNPILVEELGGKINNEALCQYIDSVGLKIGRSSHSPELKFTFTPVNDEMLNAMALPGGYIIITRGMLEKLETEAQLASILGHEALHVTARHSAAMMSQQIGMSILLAAALSQASSQGAATAAQLGTQLVGLKYSRDNEREADKFGMDYMVKAGYDPMGMVETMDILKNESKVRPVEFFSTHPSPENRRGNLLRHIGIRGYDNNFQGLTIAKEEYKKNVLDVLETMPKRKSKQR